MQKQELTPNYCPDCGPVGVPHWIERWSARIDPIMDVITRPIAIFWTGIRPAILSLKIERLGPPLFKAAAAIGLGKIVATPDEKNNWRARVIWEEATRRGILMEEFRPFGLARECFWAEHKGDVRVFDGIPRPRLSSESSLTWMDDKGVILKKFRAEGIPVPRGKSCRTLTEAESVFREINGGVNAHGGTNGNPVIVKPHLGSRSRHTYVGITDLTALRHAFLKAKELSPSPVVEEELSGFVFRITLIGGTIAGVMRREPPHVIGDGAHSVRELIVRENKNPLRHGPIFHELPTDNNQEKLDTLASQKLSLDSIPAAGQMVILHPKVSRSYGASTTEFDLSEVHPDNREMFLKICRALDNNPLVGVDFMIDDITRSWREQPKCGVIECNSLPFIDLHHYPLKGPAKNVAGAVWDLVFPTSHV